MLGPSGRGSKAHYPNYGLSRGSAAAREVDVRCPRVRQTICSPMSGPIKGRELLIYSTPDSTLWIDFLDFHTLIRGTRSCVAQIRLEHVFLESPAWLDEPDETGCQARNSGHRRTPRFQSGSHSPSKIIRVSGKRRAMTLTALRPTILPFGRFRSIASPGPLPIGLRLQC